MPLHHDEISEPPAFGVLQRHQPHGTGVDTPAATDTVFPIDRLPFKHQHAIRPLRDRRRPVRHQPAHHRATENDRITI